MTLWLSHHTLLLFLMLFLWFLLACIFLSIYNSVLLYLNLRSISHIFFVFYAAFLPCSSPISLLQTAPRSLPVLQTAPRSLPVLQTFSFSSCSPVWKFFLPRSMFSSLLLLLSFICLVCVSYHCRFSVLCTLGIISRLLPLILSLPISIFFVSSCSFFFRKLLSWSFPCSDPIRFLLKIFRISLAFPLAPPLYPPIAQYRLHMAMTIPSFLLPLCPSFSYKNI